MLIPAAHAHPVATPSQPAGPFYPLTKPLDADNDLLRVAGRSAEAEGVVAHVTGRVSDVEGRSLSGALVEIWQCDARGRYHHTFDRGDRDPNFQGYGRIHVGDDGIYRFRTIRPVPYPGRAPHIHFAVNLPRGERFTTQMYVAGEPLNEGDFLLSSVRDPAARARLIVTLASVPEIETGALGGRFDLVIAAA